MNAEHMRKDVEAMMRSAFLIVLTVVGMSMLTSPMLAAEASADRGEQIFNACAACHSLQPNRNMTGPSLAELWNRKAGTLPTFRRYSDALKSSGITWNNKTLEQWITDPQQLIPRNQMTFPGLPDQQKRADLLAFLKGATQPGSAAAARFAQLSADPNLKTLDPEDRVQTVSYCEDTYRVTTADGRTHAFWERNLRIKTDGGNDGPQRGAPALVGAGMMGDRADLIFADPAEISSAIKHQC